MAEIRNCDVYADTAIKLNSTEIKVLSDYYASRMDPLLAQAKTYSEAGVAVPPELEEDIDYLWDRVFVVMPLQEQVLKKMGGGEKASG